jgi:hypothetical protein
MSTYFPNVGENFMLKTILASNQMNVGLFKNVVAADGGVTFANFTEWGTTGTYVTHVLEPVVNETALAASQWYLSTNSSGKGSGAWAETSSAIPYIEWSFNSTDVATAGTVYGAFAWSRVLPFDSGGDTHTQKKGRIHVGDIVQGKITGAYATVTAVWVTSGTWAAGTAAGWLAIKDQTGTFQNDEGIKRKGAVSVIALSAAGANLVAGDPFEITGFGGEGATGVVRTVTASAATALGLATNGCGYSATGLNVPCTMLSGAGTGLTCNITTLSTTDLATTNTGTLFAGDSHKIIMWMETFSTPQAITTDGQKIRLTINLTLSTT